LLHNHHLFTVAALAAEVIQATNKRNINIQADYVGGATGIKTSILKIAEAALPQTAPTS